MRYKLIPDNLSGRVEFLWSDRYDLPLKSLLRTALYYSYSLLSAVPRVVSFPRSMAGGSIKRPLSPRIAGQNKGEPRGRDGTNYYLPNVANPLREGL
jgi:hypothetical protein